jgi:hypothetical protein
MPKRWEDMNHDEKLDSLRDEIAQVRRIIGSFSNDVGSVTAHANEVGDAVRKLERKVAHMAAERG